ncbi:FtsW/RodA/SpoVE family cell cycle protein [Alicyclobacillus dauci]|uniref:Rod shape-determining protein RodA n=1 Tax=Alicyclobacillus dauci TaxID=1475485 RepID=A0ABY6YZ52_9BACL|nr:FtsW/RodA/SpoVE family cell cycle protein [Alicyclobacillus dauci]WAH35739.1 rod shape-determining protein RodA [Alicyclobacillus dauci]
METLRRNIRDLDFTVFGVLLLLAVYACVAIDAATYGQTNSNIPGHILTKQIMYEIVGIVAMIVAMLFDYRALRKYHWWIYGFSMVLLVAVFGFHAHQGAHSWINLKVIQLQPSELAKIAMILTVAAFMATRDEEEIPDYRFRKTWPIVFMFLVPFALIYKEPALGQSLVMIAIALTMYTAFAKRSHFAVIMILVGVVVIGFSVIATMFPVQSTDFINNVLVKHHVLKSYQVDRILTWLDPSYDTNGAGYNVHMAQIAIGSGQLFGEGLFNGIETKGGWVPNQWTDYIFSAIGEEFGFVGSAVLVLLFLILVYRLVKIAGSASDTFGTYIVVGIIGMISFQVFENIGMDMYLSPSTGITLPFISYGGTSLVIDYVAIGIVLSIGLRRRKLRFN